MDKESRRIGSSNSSKWILTVVCMLNTWLLSGGVIYGWAPIHTMLLNEFKAVTHCDQVVSDNDVICPKEEAQLERMFQTSFNMLSIMSFVFGGLADRIGPRLTTSIGISAIIAGTVIMALASVERFYLFIIAYSLVGGGGIAPFLCHFNFANLFTRKILFISVVNGLFNVSGFNYLLFPILSLSRKSFFFGYASIALVCLLLVLATYPNRAYSPGDTCTLPVFELFQRNSESGQRSDEQSWLLESGEESRRQSNQYLPQDADLEKTPFSKKIVPILSSNRFISLATWYSLSLLIVAFMAGALPDILSRFSSRPFYKGKDVYSDFIIPIISNSSFLFAPLSGIIIETFGFRLLLLITNMCTSLILICSIFPLSFTIHAQLLTLLFVAFQKGFLFSAFYSLLAVEYPIEVNGTLISIITASAAIVGLANYGLIPLTQHIFHGNYLWVKLGLLILTLPIYWILFTKPNRRVLVVTPKSDERERLDSQS